MYRLLVANGDYTDNFGRVGPVSVWALTEILLLAYVIIDQSYVNGERSFEKNETCKKN